MYAIGIDPTNTFTTTTLAQSGKGFKLGQIGSTYDGKAYLFVSAGSAVAASDVVFVNASHAVVPLGTANDAYGWRVAVAPVAIASGDYGWVQIYGAATLNVKASCAANVRVNTTATAGSPDDDGTTGAMEIRGVMLTTARGGTDGSAVGLLNYPVVGATL